MTGGKGPRLRGVRLMVLGVVLFFFSSRRRHTRFDCDWSSDVCSSDLNFAAQVATILTETGLTSTLLELEITESMLMLEETRAARVLGELHAIGVSIEIGRASCRERV